MLLEVKNLKVKYHGAGLGVQGLNITVDKGEIVALLGANGAGKTTTLRAISGFIPGDVARVIDGTVRFGGRLLGTMAPHRRVALGMAIVPERNKVFRTLTVEENLKVTAMPKGRTTSAELTDSVYDLFPALTRRRATAAGLLSGGERQMLGIGRALMADPTLLLADEISLGIAPNLVIELLASLRRINHERGVTVIVVEQNAAAALRVADRVYLLENGAVSLEGTPRELLQRPDFFSLYFGIDEATTPVGKGTPQ